MSRIIDHTGPYWIQNDVATDLQKVFLFVHDYSMVSALQEMPHPLMALVMLLSIDTVKKMHAAREIGLWCFNQ